MSKEKLLTIIVPTYNSANYINRLIDNLNELPKSTVEVIYCDDGSNDMTTTLISNNSQNSRIIRLKHYGVSNARNVGITESNSKYITFIDSDDLIRVKKFKKILNILKKYNCDFINVSENTSEKHNMRIYYKEEARLLFKALLGINNVFGENEIIHAPWAKFYKRELLFRNKIFFKKGIQNGEDLIFNCDVLQKAKTVLMLKSDFYIYKIHNHSLSYIVPSHLFVNQNQKILAYMSSLFSQNLLNSDEFNYIKVKLLITNFARYYRFQEKNDYLNEEKKYINEIKLIMQKENTRRLLKYNLRKKLYFFLLIVSYTPFWFSHSLIHCKLMSLKRGI